MLVAASHGKFRTKERKFYEDEITSLVFGEIRQLPVSSIWDLLKGMAAKAKLASDTFSETPSSVEFNFWPNTFANRIEPDLHIEFRKGSATLLNVIIEVKWNSQLSPKCELVRQWANRPSKSQNWIHLYLTKNPSSKNLHELQQSIEIASGQVPDNCLCAGNNKNSVCIDSYHESFSNWKQDKTLGAITWRDFVTTCSNTLTENHEIKLGVSGFFGKLGIHDFTGFHIPKGLENFKYQNIDLYKRQEEING